MTGYLQRLEDASTLHWPLGENQLHSRGHMSPGEFVGGLVQIVLGGEGWMSRYMPIFIQSFQRSQPHRIYDCHLLMGVVYKRSSSSNSFAMLFAVTDTSHCCKNTRASASPRPSNSRYLRMGS